MKSKMKVINSFSFSFSFPSSYFFFSFFFFLLLHVSQINAVNILHVSDLHLDIHYAVDSPANCFIGDKIGTRCCRNNSIFVPPFRKASKWGDYNCDSSMYFLNKSFEAISTKLHKNDIVFWSGDSPSHHVITQTPKGNFESIQLVTNLIKNSFQNQNQNQMSQIIPVIGNHDMWPVDQFPGPKYNQVILKKFYSMWSSILPENAKDTFLHGGYYKVSLFSNKVKLLVLNTQYFDNHNMFIHKNPEKDISGQISWMFNEINDSCEKHTQDIWIMGHINPNNGEATTYYGGLMVNISINYPCVTHQFFGHTHSDSEIFYNNTTNVVGFVVPSIEPDKHQSSFRVYQEKDGKLLNYHQYVINLQETIDSDNIVMYTYYDAISSYEMNDISGESFNIFLKKMKTDKYDYLFQRYFQHFRVNSTTQKCIGTCKQNLLSYSILQ